VNYPEDEVDRTAERRVGTGEEGVAGCGGGSRERYGRLHG